MARLEEGNGKVNQSGRKELCMIYVIGEEKCKCVRERERGLNDAGRKKITLLLCDINSSGDITLWIYSK